MGSDHVQFDEPLNCPAASATTLGKARGAVWASHGDHFAMSELRFRGRGPAD